VLYHSILRSERAHIHVRTLATRHPRTKFVSIVGDKCIPDLPDSRVPMLIVYRKGQIVTQIIAWGSDRERKLEGGLSFSTVTESRPRLRIIQSWRRYLLRRAPFFLKGSHQQIRATTMTKNLRRTPCRRDQNLLGPITRPRVYATRRRTTIPTRTLIYDTI